MKKVASVLPFHGTPGEHLEIAIEAIVENVEIRKHPTGARPFLDGSARSPKTRWELPQACIHQNARRSEPHAAVLGVKRALQARAL